MTKPVFTFFNNKGGVGKTTLVYHISWMLSELGVKTLVVDCDAQANLTAAIVPDDLLSDYLSTTDPAHGYTIYNAISPLLEGTGDIANVKTYEVTENLHLLSGDLRLSTFEDELSLQWNQALSDSSNKRAMMVLSAFWRVAQKKAEQIGAEIILFDVGPNLGAINRSVLIGTDHMIVPLAADLFSIQGLRNLGPALKKWNSGWQLRLASLTGNMTAELPLGKAKALGYIALQHQERLSRPVAAYSAWLLRIPTEYRASVGAPPSKKTFASVADDDECIALLRHYKSLMPMAQEARKPVFLLRSADGAIGSHSAAVRRAYGDFESLVRQLLSKANLTQLIESK
jgi:chromosome partitioning protein